MRNAESGAKGRAGERIQQSALSSQRSHRAISTTASVLLFEIAVLENVGGGADEAEADLVVATVAEGEGGAFQHHDLVGLAMIAAVHYFIDSRFVHRISGAKPGTVGAGAMSLGNSAGIVGGAEITS